MHILSLSSSSDAQSSVSMATRSLTSLLLELHFHHFPASTLRCTLTPPPNHSTQFPHLIRSSSEATNDAPYVRLCVVLSSVVPSVLSFNFGAKKYLKTYCPILCKLKRYFFFTSITFLNAECSVIHRSINFHST